MSYMAANGQVITDDMVNRWCEAYEQGEFPEGERMVGIVIEGQPSSFVGDGLARKAVEPGVIHIEDK